MKYIILLLLLATPVLAADIIECDPVNGGVVRYLQSVNTGDYLSDVNDIRTALPNYIINPDLGSLNGVSQRYWKCESGRVIAMNQQEKDDLDSSVVPQSDDLIVNGCIIFPGKGEICSGGGWSEAGFGNLGLIVGVLIVGAILLLWKRIKKIFIGNQNNT